MNTETRRYIAFIVVAVLISVPVVGKVIVPEGARLAALAFQALTGSSTSSATAPAYLVPISQIVPVENRENSSDYFYTNPLLFISTDQRFYTELSQLNAQLTAYIKSSVNAHKVDSVGVYFRDMNTGHWTGVNDTLQYEPSSMLKVAVLIAYFRRATDMSSNSTTTIDMQLSHTLYYPGPDTAGQYYKPPVDLAPGDYTENELLTDMIVNSDNVALKVLSDNDPDEVKKVIKDFRLPDQPSGVLTDYMTPRSYSIVFRTLYNSTYLPWPVSERALSLLASTTFEKGLVAGVPPGTIVAHKFGEHTNVNSNNQPIWHELHDCGIIYYPGRPYLLCVMSSGQDFTKLEGVVAGLSTLAYQYVSSLPQVTKSP